MPLGLSRSLGDAMRTGVLLAVVVLFPRIASAGFFTLEPTTPTVLLAPGTVGFEAFYFAEEGDNPALLAANLRIHTPGFNILTVASPTGNTNGSPFDLSHFNLSRPHNPFLPRTVDIGGIQLEPIVAVDAEAGIKIGEVFFQLSEPFSLDLVRLFPQTGALDVDEMLIPNSTPELLATIELLPEPSAVLLLLLGAVGQRARHSKTSS